MGLQLSVSKQDNAVYADFVDAYWKIEGIAFFNSNGDGFVSFELNTYPSREASKKVLDSLVQTGNIPVGGAETIVYKPRIRQWQASFKTSEVFPNGIPITESAQKDVLYQLVKSYTGLQFSDVLED